MPYMSEGFRNRLAGMPRQCEECSGIFDAKDLFDDGSGLLCEQCGLEEAILRGDVDPEDPSNEWTFVRDQQLL